MKRILFITPRNPFPPVGGEKLKTYNAIKGLSEEFLVDLVIIDEPKAIDHSLEELGKISNGVTVFRKSKWNHLFSALKTVFNKLPLQVNYYYFSDVQRFIDGQAKNYDLVYCNLVRTALYAKNLPNVKILDMVDSIGQNYKNSYGRTKSLFWKLVYWFESKRLLRFESECVDFFEKTLFVNPFEREYYKRPSKTEWTQLGVRDELLSYNKHVENYSKSICFLGKMNYQPNVDAVIWFCDHVVPLIPGLQFVIVGAEPTIEVQSLEQKYKNVKVTGFVEDPFEIINSCLAVVAPMQTGAGVQNKVLEAMALGKPVVVSSLAAKAIIGAVSGEHFYVEDKPEVIADLLKKLPNEGSHKVGQIARSFISANYSWKGYGKLLCKIVCETVSRRR